MKMSKQCPPGDAHLLPSAAPSVEGSAERLRCESLRLAYDARLVVDGLSLAIPPGKITVIVGPNACGKSILLRALARLLKPQAGSVHLDGRHIYKMPTKEVATRLGILPQSPIAPEGLTVADLVGSRSLPPPTLVPAVVRRGRGGGGRRHGGYRHHRAG